MQDIEHDMDELFRKAAADYPLRTNESNWDVIAQQLKPPAEKPIAKKSASRYLRGLFIFFFLFTGGMFISREGGQMRLAASTSPAVAKPVPGNGKVARVVHHTKQFQPATVETVTARTALIPPIESSIQIAINTKTPPILLPGTATTEPQKPIKNNHGKFYLGLVAGPEGNQVKGQVVSKWDIEGGLIAGYNFNKRFALETGVLFTKKTYFTEGRYFNMEMPGMKLESLLGNITIIEVPLVVKYNLTRGANGKLFTTAGISSYMLIDETNNYSLLVNGTRQNMVSNYDNASKYFAAAAALSVGYQHKVGQRLQLRLQPYLKIPIRGIGVGTVPVQSMGAHIGVTYTFR